MSIENRLYEIVAGQFKISVDAVRPETDFYADLEADVLDMPELAMEVEDVFDITLDDKSVDTLHTVRDLLRYVEQRLEEKRFVSMSATVCLLAAKAHYDTPARAAAMYGENNE